MSRVLYLPPSAAIHRKSPIYFCTLCSWVGFEGEHLAYQRHVTSHPIEDARAKSLHFAAPGLFDPNFEGSDVEWGRWIESHKQSDPHGWSRWMKTGESL